MSNENHNLAMPSLEGLDENQTFIQLIKPINSNKIEGEAVDNDPYYDDIDNALIKRGTPSQSSIDWDDIQDKSLKLLANKSKDFKLLEALIHCNLRNHTTKDLLINLGFFTHFTNDYFDIAYPKSDKFKKMLLERCMENITKATLNSYSVNDENKDKIIEFLNYFTELTQQHNLSNINGLSEAIELWQRETEDDAINVDMSANKAHTEGSGVAIEKSQITKEIEPIPSMHSLDPENERNFKKNLFLMADVLYELDSRNPLSYQLRRFAIWFDINSLPPIKDGLNTIIPKPSEDTRQTYLEVLKQTDIELDNIKKLERVLNHSPYWIEGQWICHEMLLTKKHIEAAAIVHKNTFNFINSIPELDLYAFDDGTKFISSNVLEWLNQTCNPTSSNLSGNEEFFTKAESFNKLALNALFSLSDTEGLEERKKLNDHFAKSSSIHSSVNAEYSILKLLKKHGMDAYVKSNASRILSDMESMVAKDWNNDLYMNLKGLTE